MFTNFYTGSTFIFNVSGKSEDEKYFFNTLSSGRQLFKLAIKTLEHQCSRAGNNKGQGKTKGTSLLPSGNVLFGSYYLEAETTFHHNTPDYTVLEEKHR